MYGRIIELEGIDRSRREEALQNIRENVIPAFKEMDGFAGFISLVDEGNSRARSVVLWDTRENAEEAERQMKPRRDEMTQKMGVTVRSADLYEAPIVELTAGARA
jgi:heme-degrading monooxygenase HmoA